MYCYWGGGFALTHLKGRRFVLKQNIFLAILMKLYFLCVGEGVFIFHYHIEGGQIVRTFIFIRPLENECFFYITIFCFIQNLTDRKINMGSGGRCFSFG